jgi:dinuclear metal center YbgI/SA1388 family protein
VELVKLSKIIKELERLFPKEGAESWDNVGLLIGEKNLDVKKIQISLDATEGAIDNAVENGVDLIITHHPLIFSPLKVINDSTLLGRKILKLIKNNIALYSLHTNLDSAENGLNKFVAELLGGKESRIIDGNFLDVYKLSVYVPEDKYLDIIKKIKDIGISINGYQGVSYSTDCVERYQNCDSEDVYTINNKKIEAIGDKSEIFQLLNRIKKEHPYKEMAYEVISIENKYQNGGIGRVFLLENPVALDEYTDFVKNKLSIENIRLVTDNEKKMIKKVAVVNGSGMSFFKKVKKIGADLFITGDIKYHEALDAMEEGLSLMDFGHYESEHFFHHLITRELDKLTDIDIKVFNEKSVFKYR